MPLSEIPFLAFIVSVFAIFGGVLGWASWQEGRDAKLKTTKSSDVHG